MSMLKRPLLTSAMKMINGAEIYAVYFCAQNLEGSTKAIATREM